MNEPQILEAQAKVRIAESVLAGTEGKKYPVVQGTITQPAVETDQDTDNLNPGLRANWTVYDFGRRSAEIERDEFAVRYYDYKTDETVEELAFDLAGNYLEALRAKMSLDVANENLKRHQEIVGKLSIILEYDPGRRSEYTQAKAREIQVQESIVSYQRAMNLVLQRLNRYVSPPVQESELSNPFADLSIDDLLERYHVSEAMAKTHPTYLAQQEEVYRLSSALDALEKGRYPSIDVQAEANKDDAAIYFVLGGDIFNATTQPDIDEQKNEVDAALARLAQVYDNLKERADVAVIQMQEDEARIDISGQQIKALEQVVVDYEDQFIIAARSLLDVVNAYSELASVKTLQVNAQYDLMRGKLDYLSSLGVISHWAGLSTLQYDDALSNDYTARNESSRNRSQMMSNDGFARVNNVDSDQGEKDQFVRVNRNGVLSVDDDSLRNSDDKLTPIEAPLLNDIPLSHSVFHQAEDDKSSVNAPGEVHEYSLGSPGENHAIQFSPTDDENRMQDDSALFNQFVLPE